MLQKIKERILAGGEITPDEALELAQKAIHSDLYTAADEIRKKFCNKTLDTCSIIIVPKTANGAPNRPIITPK